MKTAEGREHTEVMRETLERVIAEEGLSAPGHPNYTKVLEVKEIDVGNPKASVVYAIIQRGGEKRVRVSACLSIEGFPVPFPGAMFVAESREAALVEIQRAYKAARADVDAEMESNVPNVPWGNA